MLLIVHCLLIVSHLALTSLCCSSSDFTAHLSPLQLVGGQLQRISCAGLKADYSNTLHAPPGTTPNAAQPEGRINVRFRRLEPEEDRSLATCNIVVMEFCDKGSLRHAMKRGVFHKRLGSTSVAVDLCAIVQVSRLLASVSCAWCWYNVLHGAYTSRATSMHMVCACWLHAMYRRLQCTCCCS